MKRLILFRHAKAEPRSGEGEDFDRPLTARGRRDAAAMGRLIAGNGLTPDLALVSAARRARETWDCAKAEFSTGAVEVRQALYNAAADELETELGRAPTSAEAVMIVGHNPGLQELAVNLLIADAGSSSDIDRLASRFPTAAVAAFRFDPAGRAIFEGVYYPRDSDGD